MLMRFDPFREFDRLTSQLRGVARTALPLDAYKEGDHWVAVLDLPGVDPASIDLTVEKNVLTVTAERSWQPQEGAEVLVAERPQGRFTRQLYLGDGLDTDRIQASYDQGVLTVHIPVAEQSKPRKVEITSGGESVGIGRQQSIEARATEAA
jgi:HSP20 family protein